MNKPILIRHMQHDLTPEQVTSLNAYEIVEINSHNTHDERVLWRRIDERTGGRLPAVIQTTWRGEPLRRLLVSTYAPRYRIPGGYRTRIIRAVMCSDDPERWSGVWREWVCMPDLDVIKPSEPYHVVQLAAWYPIAAVSTV